jgi:hypothetical protein
VGYYQLTLTTNTYFPYQQKERTESGGDGDRNDEYIDTTMFCCIIRSSLTAFLLLLVLLPSESLAFLSCKRAPCRWSSSSCLFGWKEWIDRGNDDRRNDEPRELLLLPFAATEALVPGQSREIVLKQGRFLELFDECMEDHDSVLGMALMGDDSFLHTVVLCEIDEFHVRSGYRGKVTLDVTLRAVRRAKLVETTQMKPIMMGYCSTLEDEGSDLERANALVDDIEILLQDLSRASSRNGSTSRRTLYDRSLASATETCRMDGYSNSIEPPTRGQRSLLELTAASWAVFAVLLSDNRGYIPEAISSSGLVDRLQLGLRSLLDEKFRLHSSQSSVVAQDFDDGTGFE